MSKPTAMYLQHAKIGQTARLARKSLSVAIAALAFASGSAMAQESVGLEEIIVTGTVKGITKMDSSLSITTVSSERAENFVPRNTTDILRSIPGIRSESSGGDSNSNISVRGVPVAAGGAKFLQLQEDGLPVLQFGDIIVGNADNYFTYDSTIERIEAVKGSTAATLSSNSPAGVINFVSKTGEEQGGSVSFTTGLDYDTTRLDFEYGQPINEDWSFHVGGFYREGEGVRDTGFDGNQGGQVKLSVKRTFDRGYARVYYRKLDDRTATILPMPMTASGSGITGLDPREASNIPKELIDNQSVNHSNGLRESSISDGNRVKSDVIGGEVVFDIDDTLSVTERLRISRNSGKFFGAFSASIASANNPGAIVNDAFVNDITEPYLVDNADQLGLGYASGPNGGEVLSQEELSNLNGNGLIQDIRTFDNDINSLDNFTNDISITKSFNTGAAGTADVTLGYYTASQDIDVDWFWQSHIADVSDEPRLLDLFSGEERLTSRGQIAFGAPQWGACCTRDTDIETDLDAVYASFNWQPTDRLSVNASIRYDDGEGRGTYVFGSTAPGGIDLDGNGSISFAESNAESITEADRASSFFEYDWSYTSYAFGANYVINDSWAVFGNISEGGRANADRLGDGGFLIDGRAAPGSVENELNQYELGVKHEGMNYGIFATAFLVETKDVNSEGVKGLDNSARIRDYESGGVEVEATANLGNFSFFGGVTFTDAEIDDSDIESIIGNTPRRQADWVYSSTVTYRLRDHVAGLSVIGTTDSYTQDDNDLEMDGYAALNAFVDIALAEGFSARIAVNNLTDEIGLTEAEENTPVTVNGQDLIRGRSIAGRSTSLELKYEF